MAKQNTPNLIDRTEAAAYLGVKPRTLDVWASTRRYNLKFIKVGRLAKYRIQDLDEFIAQRTVNGEAK